jgi:hypothetical protein
VSFESDDPCKQQNELREEDPTDNVGLHAALKIDRHDKRCREHSPSQPLSKALEEDVSIVVLLHEIFFSPLVHLISVELSGEIDLLIFISVEVVDSPEEAHHDQNHEVCEVRRVPKVDVRCVCPQVDVIISVQVDVLKRIHHVTVMVIPIVSQAEVVLAENEECNKNIQRDDCLAVQPLTGYVGREKAHEAKISQLVDVFSVHEKEQ